MSIYIRNAAEQQRLIADHARTLHEARARRTAAGKMDELAQGWENQRFPQSFEGVNEEAQNVRENRNIGWVVRQFRRYIETTTNGYRIPAQTAIDKMSQIDETMRQQIRTPGITGEGHLKEVPENSLGYQLRQVRLSRGFSQQETAQKTGMQAKDLSLIELGVKPPHISTIAHFLEGLGAEFTDNDVLQIARVCLLGEDSETAVYPTKDEVEAEIARIKDGYPSITFGKYMRMLRERILVEGRSMYIKELADIWGVSKGMVNDYELGSKLPMPVNIFDWMSALGLKPASIETSVAWALALEAGKNRPRRNELKK